MDLRRGSNAGPPAPTGSPEAIRRLRGFEACDAAQIHRLFAKGKAQISLRRQRLTVTFPRRAHNPILRCVGWHKMPQRLSRLDDAEGRMPAAARLAGFAQAIVPVLNEYPPK
jgi:hypothetical protein